MWDGSIQHLDQQSLAPLTNPIEMDEKLEHVTTKLRQNSIYGALFYRAYGDSIISGEQTLKAIAQFMLSLVSADAKYDSVMRKQSTFTIQEKKGYVLFKQHCSSCHTEPLFTNRQFENNGLPVDSSIKDIGRMKITHKLEDSLKFKVPTLRNIEFSYPYMHDGRFKRLSEVLKHYTNGAQQGKTLSAALQQPILLSSDEKVDLIAFLLTLTDSHFLFNTAYSYPIEILLPEAKEIK
jgi:cytochrome c peroxidase